MENPIVFITLLLIIGFYDDIEAGIIRIGKTFLSSRKNIKTIKG